MNKMNNTNTKLKPLAHKKSITNQANNQPANDVKPVSNKAASGVEA